MFHQVLFETYEILFVLVRCDIMTNKFYNIFSVLSGFLCFIGQWENRIPKVIDVIFLILE